MPPAVENAIVRGLLIAAGLLLVAAGLLWPVLSRHAGRLPGDVGRAPAGLHVRVPDRDMPCGLAAPDARALALPALEVPQSPSGQLAPLADRRARSSRAAAPPRGARTLHGREQRIDAVDSRRERCRPRRRRAALGTPGRWTSSSPGSRSASRRPAGAPPSGWAPTSRRRSRCAPLGARPGATSSTSSRRRSRGRRPRRAWPCSARTALATSSLRVVDDDLGAGLLQRSAPSRLPRSSRRRARRRAARSRRAAPATPPPAPWIEHGLAGRTARAADDHPPGRLVDERKRRRLLEGEPRRNRKDVARGHDDLLGERARRVLAEDPVLDAEALLAAAAELAGVAVEAGLDEDAVAGCRRPRRPPRRASTTPAAVGARDLRQRHVRECRCARRGRGG